MWVLHALCALAACATVIVTRIAWWMSHNAIARWKIRHYGANLPRPMMVPTVGSGLMICWLGMRGIVTLAAGLALPGAFPFRELISSAPLPSCWPRWYCRALRTLDSDMSRSSSGLRREYQARPESGGQQSAGSPVANSSSSELQRRVIIEQSRTLRDLRARDVIGDAAFQALEEKLDVLELNEDPRVRPL